MENGQSTKKKKMGSLLRWLFWWRIDQDELNRQVSEYDSLKIWQSVRGQSLLLFAFSSCVTISFIVFFNYPILDFIEAFISLFLGYFIYRGNIWSIIVAMVFWSFEKGFQLYDTFQSYDVIGGPHVNPLIPIIWWTIYMHAFYFSLRVENIRKKETQSQNKILVLIKRFAKEISIAIILAALAAIAIDIYKNEASKNNIKVNQKATATIFVFDREGKIVQQGSGIFINSNGLLLTNYHVIKGMDINRTIAKLPSGAYYKLRGSRGLSDKPDIAILQFEAIDTPHVKNLGNSDMLLSGEKVIAIGSPSGLENSISEGIIANPSRVLFGIKLIQFTAPISPGNSGGGLFNKDGNVIGITTESLVNKEQNIQNINFAVPINLIKNTLNGTEKKLTEESPDYYYSLGQIEENKNNYNKAFEYYNKAISVDNTYADAYVGLGDIYYEKGLYDLEVANFSKAVELNPQNYNYLYYLGNAYEDIGEYGKAREAYEKVLSIKPDDKDTLYDLAELLIVSGYCSQAEKLVTRLNQLDQGRARKLGFLMRKTACH
jgi:S1-C subfamily serine protease